LSASLLAEHIAAQRPGWHCWLDNLGYHARRNGDARHAYLSAGDPHSLLDLIDVAQDFPGWRSWQSNPGRWQATRTGATLPGRPPQWWSLTVDGATLKELRHAIGEQERLAAQNTGIE
jgi:hypothetical protein